MDHYDFKNKKCQNGKNKFNLKKSIFIFGFFLVFKLHIYCIGIEYYDFKDKNVKRGEIKK
jgi:hypothetical protein